MLNIPQVYLGNTRPINPVQRIQRDNHRVYSLRDIPSRRRTMHWSVVTACYLGQTMQPLNQVESLTSRPSLSASEPVVCTGVFFIADGIVPRRLIMSIICY